MVSWLSKYCRTFGEKRTELANYVRIVSNENQNTERNFKKKYSNRLTIIRIYRKYTEPFEKEKKKLDI